MRKYVLTNGGKEYCRIHHIEDEIPIKKIKENSNFWMRIQKFPRVIGEISEFTECGDFKTYFVLYIVLDIIGEYKGFVYYDKYENSIKMCNFDGTKTTLLEDTDFCSDFENIIKRT